MSIKYALDEEIRDEIESLGRQAMGSKEFTSNLVGGTKLLEKKIELERLEAEYNDRALAREAEVELKIQQMKDDRRDRNLKHALTFITFAGSSALYVLGFIASTNFERYGTFTTKGGQNSIANLLKIRS